MIDILYLFGGFVLLVFGGNYLVKGGVILAKHLKISTLVIGVTVVSMGTSFPELIVSIQAALSDHPDIAIGNVIGSNIANIALILGVTAIILPIPIKSRNTVVFDWPYMMAVSILLYLFVRNTKIEWWESLILIALLLFYIVYSIYKSRKQTIKNDEIDDVKGNVFFAIGFIVLSSIGLYLGAEWLVKGASSIALKLGVSERAVSVSIIAFGTSVPELATSLIAAFKKEMDISIGNIIGSNIFNILAILGVTGLIKNIPVSQGIIDFDILYMLGVSLLLFFAIIPIQKAKISRLKGSVLLLTYIVYLYLVFAIDKQ